MGGVVLDFCACPRFFQNVIASERLHLRKGQRWSRYTCNTRTPHHGKRSVRAAWAYWGDDFEAKRNHLFKVKGWECRRVSPRAMRN